MGKPGLGSPPRSGPGYAKPAMLQILVALLPPQGVYTHNNIYQRRCYARVPHAKPHQLRGAQDWKLLGRLNQQLYFPAEIVLGDSVSKTYQRKSLKHF